MQRRWTRFAAIASVSLGLLAFLACSDGAAEQNSDVVASSELVRVQLLAFNDFHGNLAPPTGSGGNVLAAIDDPAVGDAGVPNPEAGTRAVPAGGAAFLGAHVKARRAENPNTIVVGAGDLTGASPLTSNLFRDEPAVLALNAIGLDITSVGNHEFDRGLAELLRLQSGGCHPTDGCPDGVASFSGAKYTYLAANVNDRAMKTILPPFVVRELEGVKIGFIGMTLEDTPLVTAGSAVEGLSFADEVATVNALVPEIVKEGASTVVVLVHQGAAPPAGTLYDQCGVTGAFADLVSALDERVSVVVSAHTHQAYRCEIAGRLVTSAASAGRVLTKIDLAFDRKTRSLKEKTAKNFVVTRDVAPDPEVAAVVATYESLAAPIAKRIVGAIAGDITNVPNGAGETAMGDVIADAMLAATSTAPASAVIAMMNIGGIRADLTFAPSGAEMPGEVMYEEAFKVQPFGNNLVTVSLTGAQIKAILEQQWQAAGVVRFLQVSTGFSYRYDAMAPQGSRVDPTSLRLGGVTLDPTATYRVTTNSFVAPGGDGFSVFAMGTERTSGGMDIDALLSYLAAHRPLAVPVPNRIGRAG